jgi:hypothetical protein
MFHRAVRVGLVSLAFTAACDVAATAPIPRTGVVRIVNAADIADVRVRLVGHTTFLAQDMNFRDQTTSCVEVPVGEQAFVFTSGTVELTTAIATIDTGKAYSAFLVASGATRRAVVVVDDAVPIPDARALRFINGTSSSGDVYVTSPGHGLDPSVLAYGNLAVLATSNIMLAHVYRPWDHSQVRFFDPGGNLRADISLTGLRVDRLASVVFVNAGDPAGPTAFIATPCP